MQSSAHEIAKLQTRLEKIEKQNNRQKRLLVILTLLLIPLFVMGAKQGANDAQFGQITATGITIRDPSGMELVAIGSDKEQGIGISIFNTAGKRAIALGIPADGKGSGIMVADAEGNPRVGLGMDEGIPGIALVNEKGAKILAMGGGGDGYGILINDKEEVQRIGLGYRNGDAGIMLYDEKGQYIRGMFRQKDGLNYFSYIDADGKEVFE
ncbi:hypothetical protein [Desulfopila sp. IMCC35008]|uniref:hypothetical protein n=1 Tax=Desulfopila sp. IMCC35008 TaxID=2653858 RepID=UPI0013D6A84C|nr:hypothetical protein [Desulfopila sp. IMCC35008]